MTITVRVDELRHDGEIVGRGEYEFIQLPSPGDRLFLHSRGIGPTEIVRVLYAEHHPVVIPKRPIARPDPTVSLVVEYIGVTDEF
jgi:hypothetical protein